MKKKSDLQSALDELKENLIQSDETETTQEILKHLKKSELPAPDPTLLNRVTAAFRRQKGRLTQRPILPATLQFDSWANAAPLGVRGGTASERQLLYAEGEFDLDLQIVKDTQTTTYTVRGQLLAVAEATDSLEGIEIRLTEPDGNQSRRLTDALGRFTFSYCNVGEYSLQLILDDHDILLKSLTIEA